MLAGKANSALSVGDWAITIRRHEARESRGDSALIRSQRVEAGLFIQTRPSHFYIAFSVCCCLSVIRGIGARERE